MQQPTRLLSLDLLRGLTIAFMILVNHNGSFRAAYWPLLHSTWNGFTPTDLVLPTFLFIIGITTVICYRREGRVAYPNGAYFYFRHFDLRTCLEFSEDSLSSITIEIAATALLHTSLRTAAFVFSVRTELHSVR